MLDRMRGTKDKRGKYRIVIMGKNGQNTLIGTSQGYAKKADAVNAYVSALEVLGIRPTFSRSAIAKALVWK